MKKSLIISAALLLSGGLLPAAAQQQGQAQLLNLQDALKYALEHKPAVANAREEVNIAKAQVGQVRSMGLPQINASVDAGDNFIQQKSFVPGAFFGQEGFIPVTFTPKWIGAAGVNAQQLIFDGSYLIGLRASQTFKQLSEKSVKQTEIDVAEQVTKAYYSILVTEANLDLLNKSVLRLDTVLQQTKAINEAGFAEAIDVNRLQVQRNNLATQRQTMEHMRLLGYDLLKFQMGMPESENVRLASKLSDITIANPHEVPEKLQYGNRIEYSLLQTQQALALLDLKNKRSGYLPKLYGSARYGYNAASSDLNSLTNFSNNWFSYGFVGVSLQIPVFDGFRKHYEIQQARSRMKQVELGFKTLEQGIDLQVSQAKTNLDNAIANLETQKQNMKLAQEVVRVSNLKYREGVGSNIEVITAENDLTQSESAYFRALYDMVIAQVDLQKAMGTLY